MAIRELPQWMTGLEEEDLGFIRRFVLASGSLKEIAAQYGVTYPTVRLRLDRLIQRIRMAEEEQPDSYVTLVKRLALDGKLEVDTARLLISAYKKKQKEEDGECYN
ncbi:MAG: DUF2089 family protein [Eubacteriales bacterium]